MILWFALKKPAKKGLEALETPSNRVGKVCGGWNVRHHQHNIDLNYASQSMVFAYLILTNANYLKKSIFPSYVVLEVLGFIYFKFI